VTAYVTERDGIVATRSDGEKPMKQKEKLKQMPTKSREWLEAQCLKLARRGRPLRGCIIPIAAQRPTRLRRAGTIPSTASIF
jgi:hypothetical protein